VLDKLTVILVGYSGHAYVVGDSALERGWLLEGYLEQAAKETGPFGLNHLGYERDILDFHGKQLLLGIGDNALRQRVFEHIVLKGGQFPALVDLHASVSKFAKIGNGTFVARGAHVNALSTIGKGCILNTGSSIDHECLLGDFIHIAPNAVLCGNVEVGHGAFIGANAVVKEGVKIGNNAIIGAGSVVLKDVESGQKLVGNPAKKILKK